MKPIPVKGADDEAIWTAVQMGQLNADLQRHAAVIDEFVLLAVTLLDGDSHKLRDLGEDMRKRLAEGGQ